MTDPVLILSGQSIGAGFATNLAVSQAFPSSLTLDALLLETPFLSVRAILEILCPQKWLPYRHLWPFRWNHLDNWSNLEILACQIFSRGSRASSSPSGIILEAGRNELVPANHGAKPFDRCKAPGIPVRKSTVQGAYRNKASFRVEGKGAVASAVGAEVTRRFLGTSSKPGGA